MTIVDKLIIQNIIGESVVLGIEETLIITVRNKKCIEEHFDKLVEMELEKNGKDVHLELVRNVY